MTRLHVAAHFIAVHLLVIAASKCTGAQPASPAERELIFQVEGLECPLVSGLG